ncbi:MAG: hypothetical protein ACJAUN_001245 [Alcanivorax sp.]|jgi:hypothetical protein|uniref:hypothetical protein n=1 Tax=Alcanivorax sp. TaxID=1872427 RepID=UPI0039E2B112|tara:strand:+ start:895 stop:1353 length:459 start_codon:yes stop_codon:yes gene_type:complete
MRPGIWVWGVAILFGFVGVRFLSIYMKNDGDLHFTDESAAMASTAVRAEIINPSEVSVVVENKSRFGYVDLAVSCTFTGASGSEIKSDSVPIYKEFPAYSNPVITIVRFGVPSQAASVECVGYEAELKTERLCSVVISGESKGEMNCKDVEL